MTGPEIKQIEAMLPIGALTEEENNLVWTAASLCDYMLSCLAYGEDYYESMEQPWFRRNSKETHAEKLEKAGARDGAILERILWDEMKADFYRYAIVHQDVSADSEGLRYNSLEWRETARERKITIPTKTRAITIVLHAKEAS